MMKLERIDNGHEFDFGKTSEGYAKYRDIYPESMYEKLVMFGVGKTGQHILDLGSGTAVLPISLAHTGAFFTATDISENQIKFGIERAKALGFDKIDFRVCSAEDTGLPDNSFDAVTAVQCFHYFDPNKAAKEIWRVLKPGGLFCKIFMDWLPFEDSVIAEMEALVLKYNPEWSGGGFECFRYSFPSWADGLFDIETIHSYRCKLSFSRDAWLGRVMTCRGVGASLSKEKASEFENEYYSLLSKYAEPLKLKHSVHIEIYRKKERFN